MSTFPRPSPAGRFCCYQKFKKNLPKHQVMCFAALAQARPYAGGGSWYASKDKFGEGARSCGEAHHGQRRQNHETCEKR